MASENAPTPHSMIMKPICPMVEYPSDFLMSFWVSISTEPMIEVTRPTRKIQCNASPVCI